MSNKKELHRARRQVSPGLRPCRIRQAKGELHRARVQVSPPARVEASACVARVCRAVKLRGNSTGHAPRCRLRSVLNSSRGNSRVSRGVSPRRCAESVQLRGDSTGHPPRCRLRCRLRPCRIRQAKGELHKARVQVGELPGVAGVASARVESVKLRGNSTGHASRCRLRPCRIRQAKGELHRARVQVSGHASRCRLPPVSKRPQSVRVCRTGVSRRQATGHASRCRLRPCRIRQAKGELHRARVQVSPPRVESVKLRGNSTGHAGVSRRQAKGELHRARAQGVAFAAF